MNDWAVRSRVREMLSCLGESSRYRLVGALAGGERCVGDLALAIGLSQSCTTRHLQALERAGIVCGRREGRRVFFRLRTDPDLDPLLNWALPLEPERPGPDGVRPRAGASPRMPIPESPPDPPQPEQAGEGPDARPGDIEDYLL